MKLLPLLLSLLLLAKDGISETKKFALILPLTGAAAGVGLSCQNGVKLALERYSDHADAEFLFENDEMSARNSVAAYKLLSSKNNLSGVLSIAAGPSNAIAPLAQSDGVAMFALTSDQRVVKNRDKVFLFWLPSSEQGTALYSEATARGYKSIARVSTLQESSLQNKERFDELNNGRLKIVFDELLPPDMLDFSAVIQKLRRSEPYDAVWVNLFIGQAGTFAKQLRNQAIRAPLFNAVIFENPGEVKASEGALVGQWYVQVDDPEEEFTKLYQERFPGAPLLMAGNCHDAVSIFIESIKANIPLDQALTSLNRFKGAMGELSSNGSNVIALPATIKEVTEAGFKKIGFSPHK